MPEANNMGPMSRAPYWMLALLAAIALAIPFAEWRVLGAPTLLSIIAAGALSLTLGAIPLVAGRRLRNGHAERARMCRECRAVSWPSDLDVGFCLMCGSTRPRIALAR